MERLQAENAALRQRVAELEAEQQQTNVNVHPQAEQEMQRNLELLEGVIHNSPTAIFVKDAEGRVIVANRQLERMFDAEPGTLIGKTAHDLVPAEVAADVWGSEQEVILTGTPTEREEQVPIDGEIRSLLATKFPIYDGGGTAYAVGGILLDITEMKQLEDELRTFKSLVDNALDGISVMDLTACIQYANTSFRRMTGLGEAAVGKRIVEVYHDDADYLMNAARKVAEEGAWQGDLTLKSANGGKLPVTVAVFAIIGEQGQPHALAAIVRDTSEQKRMEEERLAFQQQIIDAQRAALRELSSPLIPIADDVVIMPLIGSIDTRRAQDIMETLLEGVAYHQARTAIIDITGVAVIDTQVANALIQAAQAVRLLGAGVILTGIGPAMAQTLVSLGADLSGIDTQGTLQAGITSALNH
jgi:rsbT co-antagonist protein RsbR